MLFWSFESICKHMERLLRLQQKILPKKCFQKVFSKKIFFIVHCSNRYIIIFEIANKNFWQFASLIKVLPPKLSHSYMLLINSSTIQSNFPGSETSNDFIKIENFLQISNFDKPANKPGKTLTKILNFFKIF